MIITVTPNPSLDRTLVVDVLERGAIMRSTRTWTEAAGKGVNISRALHKNGFPTVSVLPSGGSNGQEISRLLSVDGVSHVCVPIAGEIRSNVSIVEPEGVVTKVNEPGPTVSESEADAIIEACASASSSGDWVAATGSLAPGMPDGFYARLCDRLADLGVKVAIDTSGAPLEEALRAKPALVKPNRHELSALLGTEFATLEDVVAGGRAVLEMGAQQALISLGSDGTILMDRDGALFGSVSVDVVRNPVGAGDSLLAGFLAGGGVGVDSLRRGLAWAGAAVESTQTSMVVIGDDAIDAISVGAVDTGRQLYDDEPIADGTGLGDGVR